MPQKSLRINELSPIETAAKNLKAFKWNLRPFQLTQELQLECARYVHGLEDQKYGRGLSEIEEVYERTRWFRNQAMTPGLKKFNELIALCSNFIQEVTKIGKQSIPAVRAGLKEAAIHERPSPLIAFKPVALPGEPPLNSADFETYVGGPHVFGARLLWWCAAANSPAEFGYSAGFSQQLWTQPFWFLGSEAGDLKINPKPIDLLKAAAGYCLESKENSTAPELRTEESPGRSTSIDGKNTQSTESQKRPGSEPANGPGPACLFFWDGKKSELQPIQARLMEFLWKSRDIPRKVEDAVDEVWGGKPLKDDTYSGHVSKLNKRFLKARIPITVYFRNAHFSFEIHGTD